MKRDQLLRPSGKEYSWCTGQDMRRQEIRGGTLLLGAWGPFTPTTAVSLVTALLLLLTLRPRCLIAAFGYLLHSANQLNHVPPTGPS